MTVTVQTADDGQSYRSSAESLHLVTNVRSIETSVINVGPIYDTTIAEQMYLRRFALRETKMSTLEKHVVFLNIHALTHTMNVKAKLS
jgi:hypothetical protein